MNKQGKTRRFKKRYLIVVLVVVIGALSPLLLQKLREYEGELAGRLLREVVERESKGYYTVTFDEAILSLLNADIKIDNFRLIPHPGADNATTPINTFEVMIPQVTLTLENIFSILFYKELTIKSVKIVDPEISMLRTNEPEVRRPFSLEAGDLYSVISQYLKLFKIEYFQIADGAFNYDRPGVMEDTSALAISKLNFEARNFQLDSAAKDLNRVFYTDEIELVINDQSLFLADSVHKFSFGRLHLSTADQLVRFEGIKVAPRTDLDVSFYENPDLINIYDITIPSLHLSGVDFLNAYANNQLHIDSIALDRPSILINDQETNTSKENENSLTAILINYFDEVYIRSANITKAKMNLHLIANGKGRGVKLENANIRLGEFRVDSTFFGAGATSREYFQDIELNFDNYKANLPDSVHQIFVKHFKLSSFDNLIEIDSFRSYIRNDVEIRGTPDKYEIYLPEIGLTEFDWHAIANHQEADFGKFYMDQPEVRVHKYTTNRSDREKEKFDISALLARLNPYAELISFDSIAVDNGLFHWIENDEELLGLEHVQVDVSGFHFDEHALGRKDRFLFSDEIALSFSDFDIETPDRTHVITFDEFAINSLHREMHVNNIVVRPIHQRSIARNISLSGKVDRVSFEGISFLNMLHEAHFMFEHISLIRPQIDIDKFTKQPGKVREEQGFPDWIDFVNVGKFDIRNGLLRYAQDGQPLVNLGRYDLSVSNFSLDSVLLSKDKVEHTMDNLIFGGQSFSAHLPEINHAVKIKSLDIDQALGRLAVNQVTLSPLHKSDSISRYNVFSDRVILEGFDMERAFLDNEWRVASGYMSKPKVNFSLVADSTKSSQNINLDVDELYQKVGEKLKLLSIGSFGFDSGGLVLQQGESLVKIPVIDFTLDDLEVIRGGVRDTSRLFFAKDHSLTLTDPYFSLPQLDDSVHVKRISLSSVGKQLILDSVYFSSGEHRGNKVEIRLPQLSMRLLELPRLLDQRKLHMQSISFRNPHLSYAQRVKGAGEGFPEKLPLGLLGIKEVAIDSIKIEGTTLGYRNFSQDELTGLDLRNLNITIVRLNADTATQIDGQGLLWNDDIILSGSNLEYFITDSLNKIEIGSYRTSLREKRLTLTDIKMNPTLDQDAYAIAFGEQTDWINASIDSIDFRGVNWRALIFDDKVDIESTKAKGLEMSVYRDKRIARGEERFKGLPHRNLQALDIPIAVGQFDLVDGNISYTEHVEESSYEGTMTFTDVDASFLNLVNTSEALSKNEVLSINARAQLMGHGALTLNATANLKDEKGSFLVVGKLDKMDLTELNRMMEHVAFVKIRSGLNNKMEFSIEANEDFALGEMTFYYEDLKISMISKKDESEKGMGPALGSFFANAFIINSNNPRWLFVRDGNIFYERNTTRSIFNYLSKSVLSGVVSSIGARSNKRDIKRKNKEAIKQLKEQRKEERMLEERVSVYE
ncbi:MAG: hypothetical protein RIC80_02055 [Cyclobacteriaceae bacterium]